VAAPTFGTEGTNGRAPVTKAQEDQERGAPAEDIASGAGGGAGKASEERDAPVPGSLLRRRRCDDPGHVATANV
jgi:hypothetical protein